MLSHAAGTSCGYKLLWSHHSSSSLASQNCTLEQLSGCRSSHLHSYRHLGVWFLCWSTELLSTCNTHLGLRPPGSPQDSIQPVFSWYWYTKCPNEMATLYPLSPYEIQQSEIRNVTSKGSPMCWHSTFVWMHVLTEWCLWCLFALNYCSAFHVFCGEMPELLALEVHGHSV